MRAPDWSALSPLPGAYVPGIDVTLAVGKIRGVESHGMMCSERELELSDEHDGIIDLPADAPVGNSFAAYAKLDDPVIDINLTPNRPDATGVIGIARDLAASGLGRLKTPSIEPVPGKGETPVKVRLDFEGDPALPRLCAAPGQGREEWRVAEMAAAAADRHRPPARSTRWSTSPTTSPSTAAGRCMSSTRPRSKGDLVVRAPATARRSWRSMGANTR